MARKGQKKYWEAHKNTTYGAYFKRAAYGYAIDINNIRFYAPLKVSEKALKSGRFDWMNITEEITGCCCTVRQALQNAEELPKRLKMFPPVATLPTLEELLQGGI